MCDTGTVTLRNAARAYARYREPRGALRVDLAVNGTALHVFNCHFGLALRERREQVDLLGDFLRADGQAGPRVLMGDFNEWHRGPISRNLRLEFSSPMRRMRRTHPAVFPLFTLDRIYWDVELEGEASFRVLAYRRAATRVRETPGQVAQLALEGHAKDLQGIGKTIEEKIVQIVEHGEVRRGALGVQAQDLTPELASAFDLKEQKGAVVTQVTEGSPAAKAGLKAGDIITAVNGKAVRSSAEVRNIVGMLRIGQKVEMQVKRDGKARNIVAVVEEPKATSISGDKLNPRLAGAAPLGRRHSSDRP